MKTEFSSLIPSLVKGMDGASKIPEFIASLDADADVAPETAGGAVDFAILCAFSQATRQGGTVEDVLNHIQYITSQLRQFEFNLESHVEKLQVQTADETLDAKLV